MSVLRLIPPKGEAIVVDTDEALVGREANCNVMVPHPSVSRRHALIKRKQDVFFVVDQGSANGTFVDSKRIVDAALKPGSVLRFGSATFKVEVSEENLEESVGEDELVISATMIGPQTFSATVLDESAYEAQVAAADPGTVAEAGSPDEPREAEEDEAEEFEEPGEEEGPAPITQSPIPRAPLPRSPRPRAPRVESIPPQVFAPSAPTAPPQVAPSRGAAFWLMIVVSGLALLFVGAALGLGAAFLAKRLGWL